MTGGRPLDDLRDRYEELVRALEAVEQGRSPGDREGLRDGIVGLFREADGMITELVALKESIRPLVDRYRVLFPASSHPPGDGRRESAAGGDHGQQDGSTPPRPPRPVGGSVHVDHLGSSTYLERGWNAIAGGSYEAAVGELEKALSLAPGHDRAEALLGWALMRDGRIADARAVLEPLLARDPQNALARANLGFVEMREGRYAEAIEHLAEVAASQADRTAALYAHLYLGMVHAEREMYAEAETHLTRALEIGPNLIEAYWELGRVRFRAGDAQGAGAAWRQGAETNRFNPWGERCGDAAERLAAGGAVSLG